MSATNRFSRSHSIQTRLLAGFATMLLLQIAMSAETWRATNNADAANAASAAADRGVSVVSVALDRLGDTQLRLADFLRTGDAVDRVRLVTAIADLDGAIRGAVVEGGPQVRLSEGAPEIRSRLDAAVDAATARREARANIVTVLAQYQNALVAISSTASASSNTAVADATAVAVTASFGPISAISRYLVTGDPAEEDNARAGLDVLRTDLEAVLTSAPDVPPRLLRLVQAARVQVDRLSPGLTELHRANDARAGSLDALRGSVARLTETLRDYMRASAVERDVRNLTMRLARASVRVRLLWCGAIGFLLGGGISVVIGLSITRPLGRLSGAMDRLAAGALSTIVPDRTRRDEIGRMAQAMEVFKESMIRNVELKVAESKLMSANAELEELARLDGLTGLANRRCFDRTLEAEFVRCAREGLPISVILLDVDRFKIYNDTYGHQAGDLCLQRLSLVVRNRTRKPVHLAARYGGEELVVLLPEVDTATAAAIAERIRIAIRDLQIEHRGNDSGVVTASFGVGTAYPSTDIGSPADMVRRADRCLYAAKAQGRDRVVSQLLDAEVDVAAL